MLPSATFKVDWLDEVPLVGNPVKFTGGPGGSPMVKVTLVLAVFPALSVTVAVTV